MTKYLNLFTGIFNTIAATALATSAVQNSSMAREALEACDATATCSAYDIGRYNQKAEIKAPEIMLYAGLGTSGLVSLGFAAGGFASRRKAEPKR